MVGNFVININFKLLKKKNMYLKNDNIIVGLLKNMIRKNTFNQPESFQEFDDFFFAVKLDVSGLEEELILKGIEELSSNSKWNQINEAFIYSADISCASLNNTDKKLLFHVLKENLIEFRDLVLSEKQVLH
jgi:hypothetical protein